MIAISAENLGPEQYIKDRYDDISGNPLDTKTGEIGPCWRNEKVDAARGMFQMPNL